MKTITIIVDSDGESKIDLSGFHGHGCSKVMADFAGDDRVKLERTKREFNEAVRETEKAKS